jgi:hypothetical protein
MRLENLAGSMRVASPRREHTVEATPLEDRIAVGDSAWSVAQTSTGDNRNDQHHDNEKRFRAMMR